MHFSQEPIFLWLAQYAYQPEVVYMATFGMMIASGFGLPIPEEVSIVSVGLLCYMGAHPEMFPPPFAGAPVVNGYEAALVTLLAVVVTDLMIFSLGRFFGRKLIRKDWFRKLFPENIMHRVDAFMKRWGVFAAFIFRFTPGLRFPAHIAMGVSNFSMWQFVLVDAMAAAISVPTQILLIYHYGEPILHALHKFKYFVLGGVLLIAVILLVRRWLRPAQVAQTELQITDGMDKSTRV